jgi:predicted metal-binding membrane protein
MVAMMIPSVTPMILLYASTIRRRDNKHNIMMLTCLFVLGYLAIWTGFSILATIAQWGLHTASLLSPMMVSTSPILGGVILIAAGIFQLTPLKHACLRHCRSPLGFLMTEWRDGESGAFVMGLKHGMYCVGCCWLLMVLLFVTGVMNLLWIAFIAIFVLIEKLVPIGDWVARSAGILLIGYGIWMINGVFYFLPVSN